MEFDKNDHTLVSLLRLYGRLSQVFPRQHSPEYSTLNLISRNLIMIKDLLRFSSHHLPAKLLKDITKGLQDLPLSTQIYNPSETNPEILIPFLLYVLEPLTRGIITDMETFVTRGALINLETGEKALDSLRHKDLPPTMIAEGSEDHLVSSFSHDSLSLALGDSRQRSAMIENAGHVDLIVGNKSVEVLQLVLGFLSGL
jgi:hypothetical protein